MWEEGADTSATVRVLPLGPIGDPEPSWPANGRTLSGAGGGVSLSDAVADTSGGIIAVWCEGTTGTHQLRAQRLAPDGTFPWGSAALSLCDHAAEQYAPAIGADGHGGLLAAWEDYRAGGEADIWAQHVTASGQRAWSDGGSAACVLSGHQFAPAIASDGLGGAIVTWVDGPASARASYMRLRQTGGGAVPRLLSAVAAPGRAKVTWRTEPGDARRLTVQRKDAGGDWQAVAVARPDESGVLAHSDHGLATGTTVAYRLASLEPRAETYYAEVSLVIPNPRPLALRSARALAGGRTLRLLLTLETDEPAVFEVFDVQGRRVNAGPLETQGAGDYSLEISLAHKLGGGLYFVRLHQGHAARTQRMMVIP